MFSNLFLTAGRHLHSGKLPKTPEQVRFDEGSEGTTSIGSRKGSTVSRKSQVRRRRRVGAEWGILVIDVPGAQTQSSRYLSPATQSPLDQRGATFVFVGNRV